MLSPSQAPAGPAQRDAVLFCFRVINIVTSICLLLCAAAFGMAIALRLDAPHKVSFLAACPLLLPLAAPSHPPWRYQHARAHPTACVALQDLYFYTGQAVRAFGLGGALLLMLVETEWWLFLKMMPLLEAWLARGLAHVFLATLTYREAYPRRSETDFTKSLNLYRSAASAALLACGVLYTLGGMLCMGWVRKARMRREERRLEAAGEMEELDRRRRELNRLLGREGEP